MQSCLRFLLGLMAFAALAGPSAAFAADDDLSVINPPPTAKDWAALAKLPDWSGMLAAGRAGSDHRRSTTNPPPWNDKAAATIKRQLADRRPASRTTSSTTACPKACRPGC